MGGFTFPSQHEGDAFEWIRLTNAVAVVIFVPPDAPTTIFTWFSLSNMIVGHMEDSGLLPRNRL